MSRLSDFALEMQTTIMKMMLLITMEMVRQASKLADLRDDSDMLHDPIPSGEGGILWAKALVVPGFGF